jgi:hypothetical protein
VTWSPTERSGRIAKDRRGAVPRPFLLEVR